MLAIHCKGFSNNRGPSFLTDVNKLLAKISKTVCITRQNTRYTAFILTLLIPLHVVVIMNSDQFMVLDGRQEVVIRLKRVPWDKHTLILKKILWYEMLHLTSGLAGSNERSNKSPVP